METNKNISENYGVWKTITVKHGYYDCCSLPIDLVPSESTAYPFRKCGMLLIRRGPYEWILATPRASDGGLVLPDIRRPLCFEIRPCDPEFHYVTKQPETDYGLYGFGPPSAGVWRTLEIPVTDDESGWEKIEVVLDTVTKRMEFLLINKYNSPGITLRLTEPQGRLTFKGPEKVDDIDGYPVQRFVTEHATALRKSDNFNVELREVREKGERTLCLNVPLPKVSEISQNEPETTITAYFYY